MINDEKLLKSRFLQLFQRLRTLSRFNVKLKRQKRLDRITNESRRFTAYPKVGFVFQTHNKGHLISNILHKFLIEVGCQNIILFSDGCVDRSTQKARKLLIGKSHIIIEKNNTHEIENYRQASSILRDMGCEYIVLLQDDDRYEGDIRLWLNECFDMFEHDEKLSIIGLNSAEDWDSSCYFQHVNETYLQTQLKTLHENDTVYNVIENASRFVARSPRNRNSEYNKKYVLAVNRAPQIMKIEDIFQYNYFSQELKPYQYDDYVNCLSAWRNGLKVLHAPICKKTGNYGIGGMRLFQQVGTGSHPRHFMANHNYVSG